MYNTKKILAIIPARSGSKGLKDKNIKELNGKPMIAYTIEAALKSEVFADVIVSTDSQKYAEIATKYGAEVPFLRPDSLSTDEATTNNVVVYTLEKLRELEREYDYFMILQPTSPLRTSENIIESVQLLFEKQAISIVSVCESESTPLYMNTLKEDLSLDGFLPNGIKTRRQELPKYYRLNGAIYICQAEYYLKHGDLYNKESYAYIMNRRNSVDIDDELDFIMAECIIKSGG